MRQQLQMWAGWAVAILLLGAAGWLGSGWSASRYTLVVRENRLVVERGSRLFFLWTAFDDTNERLRAAYAPVEVPYGLEAQEGVFLDRDQLDRSLFSELSDWARRLAVRDDPASQTLAAELIARAALLPSLSPAEEADLDKLRGLVGHAAAKKEIARALASLREAKRGLMASIGAGGKGALDSAALADRIDEPLSALAKLASGRADDAASDR